MSALDVLKDAWVNRDRLGDSNRSRELAQFLPAALEIQEAPPNPLTRWVAWSALSLVIIAVVWAYFGEVNIVSSAEGKIIPSSGVKQIQPLAKSVVKKILVSEGEYVAEGQALVELDATLTMADEKRLSSDLQSARLRLEAKKALLQYLQLPLNDQEKLNFTTLRLPVVASASTEDQLLYKRLLWQQWQQYRAQLQALKSTLEKTVAEKAINREMISKLEQTLPIINKRTKMMKDLLSKNFASESDYLKLEQERIQNSSDLAAEKQRSKQLRSAEIEAQQQIKVLTAQTSSSQLVEITETQRQITSLQEELAKASDLNAKQILYSPVSGQVQELAINTVGGVVTEAQQLMLIVPDEEQLEVEVYLDNKDIGFVRENMLAEIKVHTFPFTKYGVIDGEVTRISDDAIIDEQRGLIYSMNLLMKKNSIWVEGKDIKLIPGMAVTAEVHTGKRRIIEFFMAPLLKYKGESIRER